MKRQFKVIKFCPKSGRPLKAMKKWAMPLVSVLALIWVLLRVVPKPQRATYPCMKVAIPFASSLLIYLGALLATMVFFKKAFGKLQQRKFEVAALLLLAGLGAGFLGFSAKKQEARAGVTDSYDYVDPLGPNQPIGEAKGILPGRVVWIHNADATNEECDPDKWGDGYFMDKNASQVVVDAMLDTAMMEVTGADTGEEAWDMIFRHFNSSHDKGDVGYAEGEKIFIKVNAVHAWPGNFNNDLSIKNNGNYGNVDTSPQVIMAVLKHLVYKAGVPQDAIYMGDPYTMIFKHVYDKLSAEFPDIHFMSQKDVSLRETLKATNTDTLFYSDRGEILQTDHHTFYDCHADADYILNIPAMKGHRWGGVTFFAKNHFGSNTADGAWRLHPGLHKNGSYDEPLMGEYRTYRVMVDLMAYEHLGNKTLVFIGDLLWGTSHEHHPPMRFRSEPFNDDWSSSILVSMDPVAIASVGLDILQEELQEEDILANPPRQLNVRFPAVDDYMHQAASSEWWPEGIIYDPEKDGTPMGSLGVHEHWNNGTDKQYSRNLGTGEGIELVYINTKGLVWDPVSAASRMEEQAYFKAYLAGHPSVLNLEFGKDLPGEGLVHIYNISGQLVHAERCESIHAHVPFRVQLDRLASGYHVVSVHSGSASFQQGFVIP